MKVVCSLLKPCHEVRELKLKSARSVPRPALDLPKMKGISSCLRPDLPLFYTSLFSAQRAVRQAIFDNKGYRRLWAKVDGSASKSRSAGIWDVHDNNSCLALPTHDRRYLLPTFARYFNLPSLPLIPVTTSAGLRVTQPESSTMTSYETEHAQDSPNHSQAPASAPYPRSRPRTRRTAHGKAQSPSLVMSPQPSAPSPKPSA
jgi:hypothetical protein